MTLILYVNEVSTAETPVFADELFFLSYSTAETTRRSHRDPKTSQSQARALIPGEKEGRKRFSWQTR
ncbi:hypothetical protein L3Q82_002005 [Scortum barcoo]|uniref:Uncharacterized protein n=1 Tax=Scortum barcoo TaxID=214431 RepID=A0ACB8W1V2_9TELE|nr:hypothetical protein L3Q82_002005 [Scortum barcoo]